MHKVILYLFILLLISVNIDCASGPSKFKKRTLEGIPEGARFDPVWGTRIGYHEYDDLLPDYSPEGVRLYYQSIEKNLNEYSSYDTTGWPIDDRIDYIIEEKHCDLTLKSDLFEETISKSSSLYIVTIINGLEFLLFRKELDSTAKTKAFLNRCREIPRFLEQAAANIDNCVSEDYYCASYRSDRLISIINDYSDTIIDSLPSMNAEISTIRDKAVISIYGFLEIVFSEKVIFNEKRNKDDAAMLFDEILTHEFIAGINIDSLLSIAEYEYYYADSMYKAYKAKLLEDDTDLSNSYYPIPDPDSVDAYCYSELLQIKNYLENNDIVSVPHGFPDIEFAKYPYFIKSSGFSGDIIVPPGTFDNNQTSVLYMGTKLENSNDSTVRFRIRYDKHFRGNLISCVFPGEYFQYYMAYYSNDITRSMPGSYFMEFGWKNYMKEFLLQHGLWGDDYELKAAFYEDLRGFALAMIIDMKMRTGELTWDTLLEYLEEMIGPDNVREFYYFSFCSYISPAYNMSTVLGRHMLIDLKNKAMAKEGENFSLREFHDKILSEGYIPIPLIAWKYGWE